MSRSGAHAARAAGGGARPADPGAPYGSRLGVAPASLTVPRFLLLVSTLLLLLVGFVMVYSVGSIEAISTTLSATDDTVVSATHYVTRQLLAAGLGIAVAFIIWRILPFRFWASDKVLFIGTAALIAIMLLTIVKGVAWDGATRWIAIGGIQFQPSEFVKIALVLDAAMLIDRYFHGEISLRELGVRALFFIVLPIALILGAQSDLGSTIIILVGILAVSWVGGVDRRFFLAGLVFVIVIGIGAIAVAPYRLARLEVLIDPWNDGQNGQGNGYQIIHSFYALAEGGLFGEGVGTSAEKYSYLPEAQNDFIFSVLGDEFGFVGCLVVIALYLVFLWAGLRIAESACTPFASMTAGGLTAMIAFQALLNIACVIGLFPTTGKTLPFISYGGSSELASIIMVGLILAVSEETVRSGRGAAVQGDFHAIRGGRQ